MEATHDNDNEKFSFVSLAAVTARYLGFDDKQKENRTDDAARDKRPDEKERERREYVDQRLRELAAFERRAGGDKN